MSGLFDHCDPPPSDGPYARPGVGVARCDVTSGRHKGNAQSEAAHASVFPKKERMVDQLLRFIRMRGAQGATCEEICEICKWMRYTSVSARLSEMKRDGLIREDGRTRPTTGGDPAAVLVVVEKGENYSKSHSKET
jgi:hypothetical protein